MTSLAKNCEDCVSWRKDMLNVPQGVVRPEGEVRKAQVAYGLEEP